MNHKEERSFSIQELLRKKVFWVGLPAVVVIVFLILLFPRAVGLITMMAGIVTVIISAFQHGVGYVDVRLVERGNVILTIGIALTILGFLIIIISGNADVIFGIGTP